MQRLVQTLVSKPVTVLAAVVGPVLFSAWDQRASAPAAASQALTDSFSSAVLTAAAPRPTPAVAFTGVAAHYQDEIMEGSRTSGVDPLALAILLSIECPSGDPACLSYAGARGLFQVMPGTARGIEIATGFPCTSQAYDPQTSINCGSWYFAQQMRLASALWSPGRDSDLLGAAGMLYNGGPGWWPKIRDHMASGGEICSAPVTGQQQSWCTKMVTAWAEAGRK